MAIHERNSSCVGRLYCKWKKKVFVATRNLIWACCSHNSGDPKSAFISELKQLASSVCVQFTHLAPSEINIAIPISQKIC